MHISRHTSSLPLAPFSSKLVIFPSLVSNPESPHESVYISLSSNSPVNVTRVPTSTSVPPSISSNTEPIESHQPPPQCLSQNQPPQITNYHPMVTRSKVGTFKPKAYVTKVIGSLDVVSTNDSSANVPTDIHEAMVSSYWQDVVHSELQALINNKP